MRQQPRPLSPLRQNTGRARPLVGHKAADHGPAERWQHGARVLEVTEQAGVLAARVLEEHLIDRLLLRGLLDHTERDSALRLRADYQAAHLMTRVTASYAVTRGAGQGGYSEYERTEAEEAAYQRWRHAVRALGITDSRVVLAVCCHDETPPQHSHAQLRRGLRRLASHYGLPVG